MSLSTILFINYKKEEREKEKARERGESSKLAYWK
jgi:hypothetical protein